MKSIDRCAALAALSVLVLASSTSAAEITGKWTWITRFNDMERVNKAEFKQDKEKLTGFYIREDQKTEIKDGKVTKENEISFSVTRERNGQQFTTKYVGKLEGDVIKGKVISNFDGQEREREWEAKRVKDLPIAGNWTWTFQVNGNEITNKAEFKADGAKLLGSVTGRNNTKSEIQEGKLAGDLVSFVIVRERDGQQFKVRYEGKLAGDTITGKMKANFGGEDREFDWVAKRDK